MSCGTTVHMWERLRREITGWERKDHCTKQELLSLIGQLQHACCVLRVGRSFLRRMIDLPTKGEKLSHNITLNKGFQSDLRWWVSFLPAWNGVSMMRGAVQSTPAGTITSDASGVGHFVGRRMVPATVASILEQSAYHSKGAVTNSGCGGNLGAAVAWEHSAMLV